MAKTWYPVVDESVCVKCGTCVAKCSHGVYDVAASPSPVVTRPDECVDHCHGCGNRCPVGAITYRGGGYRLDAATRQGAGNACRLRMRWGRLCVRRLTLPQNRRPLAQAATVTPDRKAYGQRATTFRAVPDA